MTISDLRVPQPWNSLRFHFSPGEELVYLTKMVVQRSSDASPRFSSSCREEFTGEMRLRSLALDDQGFYTLVYHRPIEHLLEGEPAPLGAERLAYVKYSPWGAVLESSHSDESALLLLPAAELGPQAHWDLAETLELPGLSVPRRVSKRFTIGQWNPEALVELSYQGEDLSYRGDLPDCESNLYSLGGRGSYQFESSMGYLASLQTESIMTTKEPDLLLEVALFQSLTLAEIVQVF